MLNLFASQDGTLVNSEISFLCSQLRLHGSQLPPENASSDSCENCRDDGTDTSYLRPKSHAIGNFVLAFLFVSAIICGVSAFYVDNKWRGFGWVPLAVLAVLAVICIFQLYRLADEGNKLSPISAHFYRHAEDI